MPFPLSIYVDYYGLGLFSNDDMAIFVKAGYLTQDQANQIMGITTSESTSTSVSVSESTSTADSQVATA